MEKKLSSSKLPLSCGGPRISQLLDCLSWYFFFNLQNCTYFSICIMQPITALLRACINSQQTLYFQGDQSRVQLESIGSGWGSDYINASFIDVSTVYWLRAICCSASAHDIVMMSGAIIKKCVWQQCKFVWSRNRTQLFLGKFSVHFARIWTNVLFDCNCNYICIYQVSLARRQQGDLFGLQVKLPPAHLSTAVTHIRYLCVYLSHLTWSFVEIIVFFLSCD